EVSSRSSNSSPILQKNHDHDDHGNHHIKKSVFMRVKEKARKLKKSISGRKRRDENESRSPYATPPGMYEPTVEPEIDKHASKDNPRETNKGSSEKHKNTSNVDRGSTDSIDSKLSGLTVSGDRNANKPEPKENTTSSLQPQDKGVSVKEYLMHKLEPGEDERALSQAITQTISPRRDKMKEAMNTLLGTEEPSQSTSNKTSNSELDGSNLKQNAGDGSSIESSNVKTGSLADPPKPSNSVESNISNASNTNTCSTSTSASGQNQNQTGGSNLKPNSSSNPNDSNPSASSSSPNGQVDTNAKATEASTSTSSHEGSIE
ncbi:hypothetical protein Ccrd_018073, partial [Cynara cardunculus var. scolymus]